MSQIVKALDRLVKKTQKERKRKVRSKKYKKESVNKIANLF